MGSRALGFEACVVLGVFRATAVVFVGARGLLGLGSRV